MKVGIASMFFRAALAGALLGLAGPSTARSDQLLVPPDPWELIHVARAFGEAKVARDALRDPMITGEIDGTTYEITFYGCYLGRECRSVLFQSRFARDDWEPEASTVAAWNSEKLFGRAWMGEDAVAVLDHAVAMPEGLSEETLNATFRAWRIATDEFKDFVDF